MRELWINVCATGLAVLSVAGVVVGVCVVFWCLGWVWLHWVQIGVEYWDAEKPGGTIGLGSLLAMVAGACAVIGMTIYSWGQDRFRPGCERRIGGGRR